MNPRQAPPASDEHARLTMRANRRRDTLPELKVRALLHRAGLRYRVDYPPLPTLKRRRADIVFTRRKIAVFIDGCYWHGCPEHYVLPKRNTDYWTEKIRRNQERDTETDAALLEAGLQPLRFWEHDDPREVAQTVIEAVQMS